MTVLDDLAGSSGVWPPEGHADRMETQADYQTLYRNRRDEVLSRWNADLIRYASTQDELVPYPSAKIAAKTLAAFLFGEDPKIAHEDDEVRAIIDELTTEINYPARLLEGAITQAVQGEIYLRPAWDRALSPVPIPTTIAGAQVIPTFRHGILVDAAIVTTYRTDQGQTVYRHLEHHVAGTIRNVLYRGAPDRLGRTVALDTIPQTADLEEEIPTEIDEILLTHVPLGRDATSAHGVSLFDGLEAMILGIHRLYSQEQHDAELARKRVAVPESYVGRDANGRAAFDRKTDLFVLTDEAEGAVGSDRNPIVPIEFGDDLIMRERIKSRFDDFLVACGISPQSLNPQETGGAVSGTARKLAQASTLRTVSAAGRYWQAAIARDVRLSLLVGIEHLGFRLTEDDVAEAPSVGLADGLLDDPVELARIILDLDSAEAISTIEKVRTLHPEWTETQVLEEVARLEDERPTTPSFPSTGLTFGDEPEAEPEDAVEGPSSPSDEGEPDEG